MGLTFAKFYINTVVDYIHVEDDELFYSLNKVIGFKTHCLTYVDNETVEIEYDESEVLKVNVSKDIIHVHIKGPNLVEGLRKAKLTLHPEFKTIKITRYNKNPLDDYMGFRD